MADFDIKRGDTHPPLQLLLSDKNGPVDLIGSTPRLILKTQGGAPTVIVDQEMDIVVGHEDDPEDPYNVEYEWDPADTVAVNALQGEVEVTWGDGEVTTWPHSGYFTVGILPDLD